MAQYQIQEEDWDLITNQREIKIAHRIKVFDDNLIVIDQIDGIIEGVSVTEDNNSDIRKTTSFTIVPTWNNDIKVNEKSLIWINKNIQLEVGIYNTRADEYKWYSQGYYIFKDTSSTYDATNNSLTVNVCDWWAKIDGTKNGQLGQLTITIPAYVENEETGEVIERNIIRDYIISTITNLGGIKRYQVDDFGEFYAMPQNNKDYETYRENNTEWNCIPYDLEFSNGCYISDMLIALRDLYPNNEMFFDEDLFIARQISSNNEDNIVVTNEQLKSILIRT